MSYSKCGMGGASPPFVPPDRMGPTEVTAAPPTSAPLTASDCGGFRLTVERDGQPVTHACLSPIAAVASAAALAYLIFRK